MNRFDKVALGAAIVATLLCTSETMNAYYWNVEMLHLSAMMWTIVAAGWIIATYGPITIAAWFWRLTKRVRAPRILHVLVLPCAVITLWTGAALMFSASEDMGSDHLEGVPLMTAALLFVVAIVGYFAALAWRKSRGQAIEPRSADHSWSEGRDF